MKLCMAGTHHILLSITGTASSGLFFLNAVVYHHMTWRDSKSHRIKLQLTPIAAYILRDRILDKIESSRNTSYEDIAYHILCNRMGLLPDANRGGERKCEKGFRRLVVLQPDGGVLFRPGASNFPLIGCASGIIVWSIAKSADAKKGAVVIEHKGALRFLREMEKYMLEVYSLDTIREILERDPPTLITVTNCDLRAMRDVEVDLSFLMFRCRYRG